MSQDKSVGLFLAVIFISMFALAAWFSSASCHAKGVSFDGTDWGMLQGCLVKHDDRWLPLENIRGFE